MEGRRSVFILKHTPAARRPHTSSTKALLLSSEYFSENEEDYSIKLDDEKLFIQSLQKEKSFSFGIKLNQNVFKNFLINGKVSDNSFILYLSESELENLSFSNFSGKVDISDVNFRNIRLNLKSGTCKLKNLKTENIELLNSAGNIYLENVNNSNYFTSENKAGNIEFKNSKLTRSEERRVGKECRSRWSPYH